MGENDKTHPDIPAQYRTIECMFAADAYCGRLCYKARYKKLQHAMFLVSEPLNVKKCLGKFLYYRLITRGDSTVPRKRLQRNLAILVLEEK